MKKLICTVVLAFIIALLALSLAGLCFGQSHDGRTSMDKGEITACVVRGIEAAGYQATKERVALLLETAAVESRLGNYDVPYKVKGSYGVFQITKKTAEYVLMRFRDRSWADWRNLMEVCGVTSEKPITDLLQSNVEFSAAVALLVYCVAVPQDVMADSRTIATRQQRAKLWKLVYNTRLGSGTETIYLKRCKECLDVD